MILLLAGVVAVVFGAGTTLILSRDLFRVAAGAVLASNAVNLFIVLCSRHPPVQQIEPMSPAVHVDPLAQALALTATVISFGVATFLLTLTLRVHRTHGTIDLDGLARAEAEEVKRLEREREEV